MRLRRTAVALLLAATAVLTATPASAQDGHRDRFPTGTATAPDGRTALVDAQGRRLQLRGFNLDKYAEADEADLDAIAAQGFTLVRLPVSWTRLEPRRGRLDPAELHRLQRLLDRADRLGLLVLVDFHQDVYGPKFGGGTNGIPLWATRDDGLPFTPDPPTGSPATSSPPSRPPSATSTTTPTCAPGRPTSTPGSPANYEATAPCWATTCSTSRSARWTATRPTRPCWPPPPPPWSRAGSPTCTAG